MVATLLVVAVALLWHVSASTISTSLLVPNGVILSPIGPSTKQKFTGEMTVTDTTTYYTIACDSSPAFWPGPDACHINDTDNSYTFSASSATTRYLMPNINLAIAPFSQSLVFAISELQSFNQTVTIDCGPTNTASAAHFVYTTLYNSENCGTCSSIVHPTLVTQYSTETDSTLYPAFFTDVRVAAASTPLRSTASSTSTKTPGPTTTSSPTISSSAPTPSPTSTSTPHASLSTGSKAGIGIGVSLGVLALAVIALLLYRRNEKRKLSRKGKADPSGSAPGVFERGNDAPAPDNSGLYEMDGKRSPVPPPEFEG